MCIACEEMKKDKNKCSLCGMTLNKLSLCPIGCSFGSKEYTNGITAREKNPTKIQSFSTGATRDIDLDKYDYEGFLSPLVLERFASYMHEHRKQSDGYLRDSDNWQKGIPISNYKSSLIRHVFSAWKIWRGGVVKERFGGVEREITLEDALCGILFNTQGLLFELLRGKKNA